LIEIKNEENFMSKLYQYCTQQNELCPPQMWHYKVTLYETTNIFSTSKHCAVTVHVTNTREGTERTVPGINLSTRAVSGQSASKQGVETCTIH